MTIQQDIEELLEKIEQEFAFADITPYHFAYDIRASFRGVLAHQKALAELLLRLSNIKPTGLWPSSANDEPETPPPKPTLRELSKDGQKVRQSFWKPGEYIIMSDKGEIVGGSAATDSLMGCFPIMNSCGWERYKEKEKPKTTGLTFLEATEDGQMARRPNWTPNTYVFFDMSDLHSDYKLHDNYGRFASWLTRDDYCANDWEIYEEPVKTNAPVKTMTGFDALKLVLQDKTVKRLSKPLYHYGKYSKNAYTGTLITLENLEADDWVEVREDSDLPKTDN